MYKVKDWETHFEGAKSKTYKNKSSCTMPCKHGLGYKKLVKSKNGAALFGAWCALVQILSRHNSPRKGYCTDTGKPDGTAYTAEDLEILTDIPKAYFDELFKVVQLIGWVTFTPPEGYHADTASATQGTLVPPNSDLDSNKDSNKDSKRGALLSFGEFGRVQLSNEEHAKLSIAYGERIQQAIDVLDGYIEQGGKKKYKSHYAVMRKGGWVWDKLNAPGVIKKGNRSEDFI
jgi:hypothetical protein